MKNVSKLLTIIFTFGVISMSLFLSSCAKQDTATPETDIMDDFGKFTKELTLYDATHESSVVILVGSNDKSVLDLWGAENFKLITIGENQTLASILNLDASNSGSEADATLDESDTEEVAAEISYRIVSKNLKIGISNVALMELPPYGDDMRGWSYSTEYSEAYGAPGSSNLGTVTCNFYGHNFWHRGFYGLWYQKSQGSGWSTIISEWKRIKNNETHSYIKTPCYYMKARRKYKGSNNSVIIEFQY